MPEGSDGADGGETAAAPSNTIFITNLAWTTDGDALTDHLRSAAGGTVTRVNVLTRNGRSRGMAFVDFESPDEARQAIEALDQTDLDGRTLNVRVADPPRPREERHDGVAGGGARDRAFGARDRGSYGAPRERFGGADGEAPRERPPRRDPDTMLYVGNLDYSVTWQELRDAFAEAGVPAQFTDVKSTQDGKSRGFAVVAMADAEAAERAVEEMNQRELAGRVMNVRRFSPQ